MDLVKIGFLVKADGLKDANTQVDALLTRVDSIGTKGKKAASDFESSQKKTKDSVKKTGEEVDKTTKALERQRIIGEYLGKGLDKTTASAIASFRQLGGTTAQVNALMSSLASNKSLVQAQKDTAKLAREQEVQAKAVQTTLAQYERLSRVSLGGGILDSINKQNKGLVDMAKHYSNIEAAQRKQQNNVKSILSDYEKLSRQSLGGGVLDSVGKQSKALSDMSKYYSNIEAQQKKADAEAEKARQKRFSAVQNQYQKDMELLNRQTAAQRAQQQKTLDDEERVRQKRFAAAQKYYQQQMELLARETAAQKAAQEKAAQSAEKERQKQIAAAERARQAELRSQATPSTGSSTFDQIKGIAAYALLSTAIYGAMTATFGLIAATIKMADEYTSTQQRLKLYIKDGQTLGEVNTFLAKSAIQNNVGLRENAALYAKLAPAMQRIGANTAATNQVVDAFGKSLRIGGATAMEAASATIQFAQAMASGKLAGDEFRSISEASPRFLKAIADGSGIAAEKLKAMSSAGALTTEVIARALVKEYHNLSKESESLGYTLEQGTNALKTGFMSLVGEFNEGAGITKYLGSLMADLGVSMIDGAKAAKENGEAVKVWFLQNADNISMVVDMFKLLATVIISRYAVAIVLARVESMRYQSALLTMAAAQAGVTRTTLMMTTALTVAGNAMKGLLAFFGGWVGLALTVAGTVASYVMFNKESEKTTKSLREEGETIEDTVAKYKELTAVQRDKALLDERKNVEATTKSYQDQKSALVANVLQMSRHNDMSDTQAQTMSKLGLWYKEGKITLDQLSATIKNSTTLSQESKDKFVNLADGVSRADQKAAAAAKVLEALGLATKGAGNEAEIAGSKFNKFLTDAETQININKLAAQYMVKYNLDQAKAVDLAKQTLALQAQKKDITPAEIKSQQDLLKTETAMADITKARADAEKKLKKEKKDDVKDLKKFSNMKLEAQTYYDILKRTNNLEVARIASQKEYINIYKGNLAVATELANIQEKTRQAESRIEFEKSLREEEDSYTRIAALIKSGADYETAKAVANAKFTDDLRGREAAELSITNALTSQAYALSDQITDQETLNQYLKEGLGIEEARFKVALSRIAKLSGGKNVFGEFGEDFENAMKLLRAKRATEASQLKINSLNREADLLTTSMAFSYTAASLAAAKLSASTQGMLYSQAEIQLTKQNEVDLLTEQYETSLKISSLLSQDSEVMRDIKSQYPTILEADAQRLETARKLLEITEAYSAKQQEQKKNPFGDFSNVNFDVFGDFGNPFKEALDGLNSFVFGMTTLDEKIATVRESMRQYQVESELASLSGQTNKAKEMMDLANKQLDLEKDLQKQKAETIDIAYGQGLKFAKSFFKENSKGYKVVSALEMALQAKKIAFTLWEKKDTIAKYALELKGMLANAATFVSTTATKIAAQMGFNVAQAQGAVASAAQAPPPVGFASAAAMIALLAGIGIAISGGGGGSYVDTSNQGTGTVFGDSEAKSSSIKNSMDLLSENSDLMLPLTSAMLASLRNIESNIGGLTNLLIRTGVGKDFNIAEGFKMDGIGSGISKTFSVVNDLTFGLADFLTLGLFSAVGDLLGSLFGTKTTVKGQGLFGADQSLASILENGFSLQEYVDVNTKKKTLGITTSNKNKTILSAADQQLANQFTLIFEGFYDSILNASTALGMNVNTVADSLEGTVISMGKINLQGLNGEQIQEKLTAVFGAAADKLAQTAVKGLDDFQQVGEGYYETLVRVATGVEQAAYFTDRLNVTAIKYVDIINKQGDVSAEIVRQSVLLVDTTKNIKGGFYDLVNTFEGSAEELTNFIFTLRDLQDQLFMTGKDADYLTSSMILGAGGLDSLASGLDAYFEMLSPAEQAAELTRRLTKEFAIFGKELPSDVKAFRNLVNSIDVSTEAGQKLYGQIIALAPEFNDLQDALDSANSEVNALVQSLRDLAEQARAARGETEQPRNLDYLRNEFNKASALAAQGDTEAANRLLSLGKDLMSVSKIYAQSSADYAKDLALIQRAATVAADLQANGLGVDNTSLNPATGTTTTPTVNTTNTTMSSEMKQMREEFNAGILAVAKFVQKLDARTERWDDGNRMMVGITPEIDDVPLNVKVVT